MQIPDHKHMTEEERNAIHNMFSLAHDGLVAGHTEESLIEDIESNENAAFVAASLILLSHEENVQDITGYSAVPVFSKDIIEFNVQNEHFPEKVFFSVQRNGNDVKFVYHAGDKCIPVSSMKEAIEKNEYNRPISKACLEKIDELEKDSEEIEQLFEKRTVSAEDINNMQRAERGFSDCDVWNMYSWFIDTIKGMLQQLRDTHTSSPGYLGENYTNEKGYLVNTKCHAEWDAILDRMIFLLGEMDEATCTEKNKYEDAVMEAYDSFHEKYGMFGDGLKTEGQKEYEAKRHSHRMYFPDDEPGRDDIKELFDKYHAEEKRLNDYRNSCKDEFFRLFSKHFYSLWD